MRELRLELLKLTYTHGREAAEAVERAKVLEAYISSDPVGGVRGAEGSAPPKRGPGRPPKPKPTSL